MTTTWCADGGKSTRRRLSQAYSNIIRRYKSTVLLLLLHVLCIIHAPVLTVWVKLCASHNGGQTSYLPKNFRLSDDRTYKCVKKNAVRELAVKKCSLNRIFRPDPPYRDPIVRERRKKKNSFVQNN